MDTKKNKGELGALGSAVQQTQKDQLSEETRQLFESFEVDFDHREKPEEFLFSWCGKSFIQLHKLNGITATGATKVAAGKSMLCCLLMSAGLLGEVSAVNDPAITLKCLVRNCISLYIDAEMGRSSTKTALLRVKATCSAYRNGTPHRYKQRIKAASIGTADTSKMLQCVRFFIEKYRPDVVYIDNMVFMLDNMDVNGPNSALRIAEIDNLCKEYDTTIILVAHGNKSAEDANIAGVAGTMMMRLSSYILAIEEGDPNNPGRYKKVFTQKARQGGFDGLPDFCFHLLPFSCDGIDSVYPVIGQPISDPNEDIINLFESLFVGKETMTQTEMKECIMKEKFIKERRANYLIKNAVASGVIEKVGKEKRDPYKFIGRG